MKFFLVLALSIISLRTFSRIYGHLQRIKHPRFLVQWIIEFFMNAYDIDMKDYKGEASDYKSMCEFFVRPLDPAVRPLTPQEGVMVSPSDGLLTEIQTIHGDAATQVKGKTYSVSEMVGESLDFSQGWHVAVIYLSPTNYHRYHYPLSGKVTRYLHTGARLYPVNQMGINYIDALFVKNERIVTEMEVNGQPVYIIPVGATFVGSIKMEFIKKRAKRHQWHPVNEEVTQLDELGRFELGSTIVMVFPEKLAEPMDGLTGKPVRVGQPIFRLK